MKDYIKRMMEEHCALIIRIDKLDNFLYGNNGLNVHTDIKNNQTQDDLFRNISEYANKCMQLMSMRNYLKSLECRLNNEGIFYEDGEYLERVGRIIVDDPSNKSFCTYKTCTTKLPNSIIDEHGREDTPLDSDNAPQGKDNENE